METRKVLDLIKSASKKELVLPDFQRDFTYDRHAQKKLVLSVLTKIPLGSILIMNAKDVTFNSRLIGRKGFLTAGITADEYLLDGQQRLTTLWNVFTDIYEDSDKIEEKNELFKNDLHPALRSRWYLTLQAESSQPGLDGENTWGLKYLDFDTANFNSLLPDDLSGYVHYTKWHEVNKKDWNWGSSLRLPSITDVGAKEFRTKLMNSKMIPLHILTDATEIEKYLERYGNLRALELKEEVGDYFNHGFDDLDESGKHVLGRLFDVDNEDAFKQMQGEGKLTWDQLIQERLVAWKNSLKNCLYERFQNLEIGVVNLEGEDLVRATTIFQVINEGGKPLDSFDLFCASKPGVDVRKTIREKLIARADDDPKKAEKWLIDSGIFDSNSSLSSAFQYHYMNLLRWEDVVANDMDVDSFWRHNLNKQSDDDWKGMQDSILLGIVKGLDFSRKRLGIKALDSFAYKYQFLPIAYVYSKDDISNESGLEAGLKYWFWLSAFGGWYREQQNYRMVSDMKMIAKWVSGISFADKYALDGSLYEAVLAVDGYNDISTLLPENGEDRLWTSSLRTLLVQFVLSRSPNDMVRHKVNEKTKPLVLTAEVENKLELHHLLPLAAYSTVGESSKKIRSNKDHFLNSPLNFVLITDHANRVIGKENYKSYSDRLSGLEKEIWSLPDQKWEADNKEEDARTWLTSRHAKLQSAVKVRLREWHQEVVG